MSARLETDIAALEAADIAQAPADLWKLLCPECGGSAFSVGCDLMCPAEGRRFEGVAGILPLLREARARELAPFLESYRRVRRDEGWGGAEAYYLGLPFQDRSGRHSAIWRLRARSFRTALRKIEAHFGDVKRVDEWNKTALRILELGAGNAWFSWRMAESGHYVLATDISIDEEDGLGAVDRYARGGLTFAKRLTRARADMQDIPLEASQCDLVVAAGSLHYAEAIGRVLSETRRVLRRGGLLLVLDSPTYEDTEVGRAMVRLREREHERRYGIRPQSRQAGFLVLDEFRGKAEHAGFRMKVSFPFEGISRALRRSYCWARGCPPPARFPVFSAEKR